MQGTIWYAVQMLLIIPLTCLTTLAADGSLAPNGKSGDICQGCSLTKVGRALLPVADFDGQECPSYLRTIRTQS
jgi:hypothetical protein